jgi:protein-disulfide isomerase
LIITRRAVTAALSWTGVAALIGLSPFRLITEVLATGTTDNVAEPVSLPEVALGPADAAVTMTEYASITCPHCAAFNENVFPKIRAAYIDTGKIRYVFHEFPLDPVAAASSVLSRCIAKGDSEKYFAVTDLLFRQPWAKVTQANRSRRGAGRSLSEGRRAVQQDRCRAHLCHRQTGYQCDTDIPYQRRQDRRRNPV